MARTISSAISGTLVLATADNPLTITSSGSVTAIASGADAIDGGSSTSWSITNYGAIASSLGYGVYLNGTGSSVFNSGSISGQGAVHLATGGSVTNYSSGTIKATGTTGYSSIAGVQISGSGTVNNYGTISAASTGYGVSLDNGGTVTNSGSITGGEDGVIIQGAGGQLINTGTITGTVDDGVNVVGSVVNGVGGSISAPNAGAGVYIPTGAGNIQNDGSISGKSYGVYLSAGGSVTNGANSASASMSGGSYGVYVGGGAGTVTNAGTISGGSYAVYFSYSNASNKVVVDPGAVFNGVVAGGQGTLELASGVGSISGVSSSGSFRNFQNLAIDAGGAWTLNGVNNSIANVTDNGTLVVTGSLKISTAIDTSSCGQFQLGVTGGSCTLEVASETGSLSQTNFVGDGKLIIDNAGTFGANVGTSSYTGPLLESFAAGDAIQILNFSASGATISFDRATGLAQISNGTQKATLDFQTSTLAAGSLQVASDGGTGTYVTLSPAPSGPTVSSIVASGAGITSGTGDLNAGKVVTLTVNFSAPVTVNTAGGSPTLALNDSGTAAYVGGSGTAALTFSYTVAAGQNTPDLVVSSFKLNGATVQDGAGSNADLSGAINYNPAGILQIDTTPPAVTESLVSDTGVSATDKITSNDALTGSGDANAVVHFTVDSAAVSGTATADGTGKWNFTPTGLADGQHTVVASETDAAGNTGTASLTFTLDTTAPVVAITSTGGSVNQATQTVTGTVDVADAGTTVTVFDGTAQAGTATVQTNGSWSTSVTLAAGTNMLTAQDTDAAGNTGVSNAVTYTLNTTAPVVSSIVTSGTGITNGNGDLNAGKVVTLTVNFSAPVTVNTAGGSPTLALNDSGTAAYTGGSGTSALTFSYTVAAGQNTPDLVVSSFNLNNTTIQDGAGSNADLSGATNYNPAGILQIDTTVPTIAINNIAGNNTINASKASKGFAISGTTTDAENGQIVSVNIVNSQNTVVDSYTTADQNSAWSVNVTSTQALALIDGIYTVTADVPDQAGNLAPLATRSLTVEEDNKPEAPILTIASTALTVQAGGSISLGITATPIDSDDSLAVVIAGVPSYEAITAPSGDLVSKALQSSGTYTWTISETSSTTGKPLTGLTLASTYTGAGNPVAPLTVTASNTTRGETANSPSQTIAVTDPPAIASSQPLSTTPTNPTIAMPDFRSFGDAPPAGLAPSAYTTLAALLDQYMAARSCQDAPGVCQTSWTASQQAWLGDKEFLTRPQC